MPEMDGWALYEEIQRDYARVLKRIVFVTARAQSFEYAAFLRDSSIPLLEKPVTLHGRRRLI